MLLYFYPVLKEGAQVEMGNPLYDSALANGGSYAEGGGEGEDECNRVSMYTDDIHTIPDGSDKIRRYQQ